MKLLVLFSFITSLCLASGGNHKSKGDKLGCRKQMETLCGGEKSKGKKAWRMCKKNNVSKLSAECQEKIKKKKEKWQAKRKEMKGICSADLKTHCPNIKDNSSKKERRACMKEHKEKFSSKCKEMLNKKKAKMKKRKQKMKDKTK